MLKTFLTATALLLCYISFTQITLSPTDAGADDEVTLIYDAAQGNKELLNESKIYIHHGVIIDKPDGTAWQKVKGNWGKDDGIGLMTKIAGTTKWEFKFKPTLRQYFGASTTENIFRIACVFRSADGNKKGTINAGSYSWGTVAANHDIYVNLKSDVPYLLIDEPIKSESYLAPNASLPIKISASANVSSLKIFIDEGSGYLEKAVITSGKTLSYNYIASKTVLLKIKGEATINGQAVSIEKNHNVILQKPSVELALPSWYELGINYENDSTVTLVLEAPNKKFVYAVGDFNNWTVDEKYQMYITPNREYFWITLNKLTPKKEYVFQYWVDGTIKIPDPYTEKIADPWNDQYIESKVYPNLPKYNKTIYGIASVLQTAQEKYNWASTESSYVRPNANHIVIYELHIRDFIKDHDMKTLIDTLSYLKKIGVNAIEFMPLGEFEGNDSWGYNPSVHYALDKYYGSKNDLKKLIEACHKNGMAAILDIVLNHAYSQNPLVQMYFENGKPKNNPWFNADAVGPYSWGYDFNHESDYTKRYVDRVNKHWLEEFHFDGFRFDFTKGFTNSAPGGSVEGFDQSRINILKRMADKIRDVDSKAIIILEHWASPAEEKVLGDYGMKMWRNKSYDYVPTAAGNITGTFADMSATTHVALYNSHDEQRIAKTILSEGRSSGNYDTKQLEVMYERVKLNAAFFFLFPGPKMMWQFDELGYDIDINFNGRIGAKPLPWGNGSLKYYEDDLRQNIYKTYQGILDVRNTITPEIIAAATTNHSLSGGTKRLVFNTSTTDIVLIGNYGVSKSSISPAFVSAGKWYDYFSGQEIDVTNTTSPISLEAGEWHLYTSERLSDGKPGVVEIYQNPVTITPDNFTQDDEITLTFDAKKASKAGTSGLVGASKVYFHSGVVKSLLNNNWANIKGNLTDDGVGEMTKVSDDIWQIKFIPAKYYNIAANEDIYKLAMYFRDATNTNLGKGFRDKDIFMNVASNDPFVTIEPSKFDIDTEITITFNALQGNRELAGSPEIYIHSGIGLKDTPDPASSAWNKVVGNWGKDDGLGKMTKVSGTDLYRIKLVPRTYYGLKNGDFPYWIAAVFRNADGSKKGTGNPGPLPNGFIAANQDFFFKNNGTTALSEEDKKNKINIFPNPSSGMIHFSNYDGELTFNLYGIDGKMILSKATSDKQILLPPTIKGMFTYKITNKANASSGLLVIE